MNDTYRDTALELYMEVLPRVVLAVKRIRPRNKRLANQLEDSAQSVSANLAEADTTCRGNSRSRLETAYGSLKETRIHLKTALIFEYLTEDTTKPLDDLLDRVCAMTWKRIQARQP